MNALNHKRHKVSYKRKSELSSIA